MVQPAKIHGSKQPNRPHFIRQWAERRGYNKPSELADELGIQRSLVTNWYRGTSPQKPHQLALAELFFPGDDPEERRASLFRHPDEDWFFDLFAGQRQEEIDRIKAIVEAAIPRKTGSK